MALAHPRPGPGREGQEGLKEPSRAGQTERREGLHRRFRPIDDASGRFGRPQAVSPTGDPSHTSTLPKEEKGENEDPEDDQPPPESPNSAGHQKSQARNRMIQSTTPKKTGKRVSPTEKVSPIRKREGPEGRSFPLEIFSRRISTTGPRV